MKTLLVIAGMIAGLSAAHAAEKDDLVSAFKAACMGNGPFIEMVKDFAKTRGWRVEVRESKQDPKLIKRMGMAVAIPSGQIHSGTLGPGDTFIMVIAANAVDGPRGVVDSCKIAKVKLGGMEPVTHHVDRVLGISAPSHPLSPKIRKYLLEDELSPDAKQWALSSTYTDYVILSESQRAGQPTSLERIRAPLKEKP